MELAAKEAKIKQLEEELAKKYEQQNNCTEKVQMTAWQKDFLSHCFGNFENCSIQFDPFGNATILDGKNNSVKEHHLMLLQELKKLKEELLALTPVMHHILCKDLGKRYLDKLNASQLNGAKAFLQDESLLVTAKDDQTLNRAMNFLKTRINYKETIQSDAKIPIEQMISLQYTLESKYLVEVCWTETDQVVRVEGIKDDVFESSRQIKTLLEYMGGIEAKNNESKKNYSSSYSCDSSSDTEMTSEDNLKQRGAKQRPYRGQGASAFVVPGRPSINSYKPPNDKCNDSEKIISHDNQNYSKYHFKSDIRKQSSTCLESPESSVSTAQNRVHEQEIRFQASQGLPEQNLAFQIAQKENNKTFQMELAAKEAKIKQLEEELAKKDEQQNNCTERVRMPAWQKEFLSHCFGTFENCSIQFDPFGNVTIFEGKNVSVKEHHLMLLQELKKWNEELLALTPVMRHILCRDLGKQYLDKLNASQLDGAKAFLQDESLLVTANDDPTLNRAMNFLKTRINYKETIQSDAKIPIEQMISLQYTLESKYLVNICWNDTDQVVNVEGIKDDVFESSRQIKTLLEEHGVHEQSFIVTELYARFFHKNLVNQIKQYLQDVEIVDFLSTEAHVAIKFKGDRKTIKQIYKKLAELKMKVITKSWDLRSEFKLPEELMLVTQGFSSEKMKNKVDRFEGKNQCIVITKLPDKKVFTMGVSKKTQHGRSAHASPIKRKPHCKVAVPTHLEEKLIFSVSSTCQLVIKPYGDITKESSDILVSLLTNKVDLRNTRVGITFNKVCPTLWRILQAEHEAHPDDTVLTTKGQLNPLKCQAVCHIILTPWNITTSHAQLYNAISLVIAQATALGAKSVSFPVLGCGKAFGFPPSDVAQISIASLKSLILGSTLQKVVFLAPDSEVFKEFKNEASKHFQAINVVVKGAVGGVSPNEEKSNTIDDDSKEDNTDESDNDETFLEISQRDSESTDAEISITALNDSGIDNLWSILKKDIAKMCLHTKYFNQEIFDIWPNKSKDNILQKAKKLSVWVKLSPNPKTKKPGYVIKGEKDEVEKIFNKIQKEFTTCAIHLPKYRIKSDKAPRRGTTEFLKHAAGSDEHFPSYWELSKSTKTGILTKLKNKISKSKEPSFLVDVDSKTMDAIKKLIVKTWDPSLVGRGNDAAGLSHSSIEVTDVKRIENMQLFIPYSVQRNLLFKRLQMCPDIGKLHGSKGRVVTSEHIEDFMKEELYYEINEHYLFYGTQNPDAIIASGIDPHVSNEARMFGRGIYTAERFTKSDQYTDSRKQRSPPGTKLTVILARVLLGNAFLVNEKHESVASKHSVKLTRPPCVQCFKDVCNCPNQKLFDSVLGDGMWMFREFVVYEKSHCYPEYLITYERV